LSLRKTLFTVVCPVKTVLCHFATWFQVIANHKNGENEKKTFSPFNHSWFREKTCLQFCINAKKIPIEKCIS
jgi:hypothetical protein